MIKWALSVVDGRCHGIDTEATQPTGVYVALCRHVLLAALTSLEDSCRVPCVLCFGHAAHRVTRRE